MTTPFPLGRRMRDEPVPSIKFSAIRTAVAAGAPLPTDRQLKVPDAVDYLSAFKKWEMLGNNDYGVCNAVAWANQRRLVTSKLGRREVYPNLEQVYQFYKTSNPGFNPPHTKRDDPDDKGMFTDIGLNYLVKNPGPDGVKAIAFAEVDVTKMQDVHAAIAIFGCIWVDIKVFTHNDGEFQKHTPWTAQPNPTKRGAHAVLAGGYTADTIKIVTWADVATLSKEFWGASSGSTRYVDAAWVVIWPEDLGTRSFMSGVDVQKLATEFKRLTKGELKLPPAPFNSLYYVKYINAESGSTEVHTANAETSYNTLSHAITSGRLDDAANGTWVVESDDLYFIKTKNAESHTIEVHRLPNDKKFSAWDVHSPSGFSIQEASNGIFTIDNGDLYFIKTKNVSSGFIEVHMADHQKNFAVDYHQTSKLSVAEAANGYLNVQGGNLYLIKTRNTTSGKVEMFVADGPAGAITRHETWFSTADDQNGIWNISTRGDLYFIKIHNPQSGRIELHIATASSDYKEVAHYATGFGAVDANKGFWTV